MRTSSVLTRKRLGIAILICAGVHAARAQEGLATRGQPADPATFGPVVIESWDDAVARSKLMPPAVPDTRNGAPGEWVVPGPSASEHPHSGRHLVVNKWGDTRMGIGFPGLMDVYGAYFAAEGGPGSVTTGVRAIGYRQGQVVGQTDWLTSLGATPKLLAMNLREVDRIVIESQPVTGGAGWYSMDDLAFAPHKDGVTEAKDIRVVNFDDVAYKTTLTNSNYAGLTWEKGTGDFNAQTHPMPRPTELPLPPANSSAEEAPPTGLGTRAVGPSMRNSFQGVTMGDAGQFSIPPDTMGAVGPQHFVIVVNSVIATYDKATGGLIGMSSLPGFFNANPGIGDPRILFDTQSQRWFIIATTFNFTNPSRVYLAVSTTSYPIAYWFKTYFTISPNWVDYPTLGVDPNGVYTSMLQINGASGSQSIWAFDKAPLIASPQHVGALTKFDNLPYEGAMPPAHTYGDAGGEYFVSRYNPSINYLRIRKLTGPITSPSLAIVGHIPINSAQTPGAAPALGSTTWIDTGDGRMQSAVWSGGFLYTAHTIAYGGMTACRWYQLDPVNFTAPQMGTIWDGVHYFYYPSIMVNKFGDVALGCSGSNANEYVGAYYSGHKHTDAPSDTAVPVRFRDGVAPYVNLDNNGRNRWGDYSYTTLDPNDSATFFTIQEFTTNNNTWSTYVAQLSYGLPGDLNCDGVVNFDDINPFVLALSDPAGYQIAFPNCNIMNGDCNGDGLVNFDDINAFVAILTGPP